MHRIILLFLAALAMSTSVTVAEEIWHLEINDALDVAKQLKRPVVISIEEKGCIFCETMRETWTDSKLEASIRNNFVALRLDKEKHASMVSKLKLKRFPATIVYSKQGKLVEKKEGVMFAGQCRQWMTKLEEKLNIISTDALVKTK